MAKILYVEDDLGSRQVLQMISQLRTDLMDLTVYESSEDFLKRLQGETSLFDMILLDIHIKPLNGFEMLTLLRQHSDYQTKPIVALTASVMNEEIQTLKDAGFDGVLSKPVDVDSFPDMIERILDGEKIWYVW